MRISFIRQCEVPFSRRLWSKTALTPPRATRVVHPPIIDCPPTHWLSRVDCECAAPGIPSWIIEQKTRPDVTLAVQLALRDCSCYWTARVVWETVLTVDDLLYQQRVIQKMCGRRECGRVVHVADKLVALITMVNRK